MEPEKLLGSLALEIAGITAEVEAGTLMAEALPSAVDLSRKLDVKLEAVKKKLRVLKSAELVQPVSFSPKRYRFNRFALRELPEENDFYRLFCEAESPYFIEL